MSVKKFSKKLLCFFNYNSVIRQRRKKYEKNTRVTLDSGVNLSRITSIGKDVFDDNYGNGYGPNAITTVTIYRSEPEQGTKLYKNLVGNDQFDGFNGTISWNDNSICKHLRKK